MFSLIRGGPKIVLIETSCSDKLLNYLKEEFKFKECNLEFAYENCGEDYTIICIVKKMKEVIKCEDIFHVLLAKIESDVLFCNIINENKFKFINKSRLAPRIIVMRAIGDFNKTLKAIQKDYNGYIGNPCNILNKYNNKGNMIILSKEKLSNNVKLINTYEKALYVEGEYYDVLKGVRNHALSYLNEGLQNIDWNEIEIKIYDKCGQYEFQYERLVRIIDTLELGLILGEGWGRDYPRFLMSVEVYRVRMLTLYSPKYIKKVLLALEYLKNGTRIVDYDIYYNRKKIEWIQVLKDKSMDRDELGLKYRKNIFNKLSKKEIEKINSIEDKIKKYN